MSRKFRIQTVVACAAILLVVLGKDYIIQLTPVIWTLSFFCGFFSVPLGFIVTVCGSTNVLSLLSRVTHEVAVVLQAMPLFSMAGMIGSWLLRKKFRLNVAGGLVKAAAVLLFAEFISIFVAYFRWGQPILRTFLTFRTYFLVLIIFPITDYIKEKPERGREILRLLDAVCVFGCIMMLMRVFLGLDMLAITTVGRSRIGAIPRTFMHEAAPYHCFFAAYNYYLFRTETVHKLRRGAETAMYLFILLLVAQTKGFILSVVFLLPYVELVLVRSKVKAVKVMFIVLIGIVISPLVIEVLSPVVAKLFYDVIETGSDYGRIRAAIYYWGTIKGKFAFFGAGLLRTNLDLGLMLTPDNQYDAARLGAVVADLGVFGYFYTFGLQGLLGLAYFCLKMYKVRLSKENKVVVTLILLGMISQLLTVSPLQHYPILYFAMAFAYGMRDVPDGEKIGLAPEGALRGLAY